MRNFRFAVVAGAALLLWPGWLGAEETRVEESRPHRELARRFVGCSLHWEENGHDATLIFVSEDRAWWMSAAWRSGGGSGLWYPLSGEEVVCYGGLVFAFSIRFQGNRFTMQRPGGTVEGEVLWPQP